MRGLLAYFWSSLAQRSSGTWVRPNVGRLSAIITLVGSILLLGFYVHVWREHDPRGSDFTAFYSGAILWERHQPVFDRSAACQIQSQLGGRLCMPFFHPPLLLPLVSLLSNENYHQSYLRWMIVLLMTLALCTVPLYGLTKSIVSTLALMAFLPLLFGFLHGQDSLFVLLGLLFFPIFLRDGRDTLAGVALSLTALRPTLAIALGIPLLFANRRAFCSFFVSGLVLTLYSFMLVGTVGFRDLAHALVTSAQTDPTTRPDRMYSVVGVLSWLGLSPIWAWILFVASVPWISILWRKRGLTFSTFAFAILLTTFTSPHLHVHDLAFLMVPLIAWPAAAVMLASVAFMVLVYFNVSQLFVYALMLALALHIRITASTVDSACGYYEQ
jgi:hypothetical protein